MKTVRKTICGVIWCVAEKNSMQIGAAITEKMISSLMSLNRPIVDKIVKSFYPIGSEG